MISRTSSTEATLTLAVMLVTWPAAAGPAAHEGRDSPAAALQAALAPLVDAKVDGCRRDGAQHCARQPQVHVRGACLTGTDSQGAEQQATSVRQRPVALGQDVIVRCWDPLETVRVRCVGNTSRWSASQTARALCLWSRQHELVRRACFVLTSVLHTADKDIARVHDAVRADVEIEGVLPRGLPPRLQKTLRRPNLHPGRKRMANWSTPI